MSDDPMHREDQQTPGAPKAQIDPRMLESLVCPLTHGPLHYDRDSGELISRSARLAFPVRSGVPILLESEARKLPDGA